MDSPGLFKISNTLPSFKIFAGLKGPSYSFSFLLLMLLTAMDMKTKVLQRYAKRFLLLKFWHIIRTTPYSCALQMVSYLRGYHSSRREERWWNITLGVDKGTPISTVYKGIIWPRDGLHTTCRIWVYKSDRKLLDQDIVWGSKLEPFSLSTWWTLSWF